MLEAQNSQRQTEKSLEKRAGARNSGYGGGNCGSAAMGWPWGANHCIEGTGQQLEPLWSSGSIQDSPVPFLHHDPGRTLRPFIPMDQPQAGGKDTVSANGLHIPNHFALTQNSRLPFLKGLSFHTAKTSKDISLDLQSSPCMLRLFSYKLREGA